MEEVRAEGHPCGDDGAQIEDRVVDTGKRGALRRIRELDDHKRTGIVAETETEAEHGTRADEHVDILRGGLEGGTCNHDSGAEHDGAATAEHVRGVGSEWDGTERADGLDGTEQAEFGTSRVVEIFLPLIE